MFSRSREGGGGGRERQAEGEGGYQHRVCNNSSNILIIIYNNLDNIKVRADMTDFDLIDYEFNNNDSCVFPK